MDAASLFGATVPVFRHYIARLQHLLSLLADDRPGLLERRLADGGFTAGEHLHTAQGFVLRTVFPLLGQDVPTLSDDRTDIDGLKRRCEDLQAILDDRTPADFEPAVGRVVSHTAGMADLRQTADDYATLYALPNFFFHLTMGYATLRQAGVDVGKGDFDGWHSYPKGFRFPE